MVSDVQIKGGDIQLLSSAEVRHYLKELCPVLDAIRGVMIN